MPYEPSIELSEPFYQLLLKIERDYGFLEGLALIEKPDPIEMAAGSSIGKMISGLNFDNFKDKISYRNGFAMALEKTQGPIDKQSVLDAHRILFEDIVKDGAILGVYRRSESGLIHKGTKKIMRIAPHSSKVERLMEDLIGWVQQEHTVSPVLIAGIFFIEFLYIHPFVDGNRRVAELLTMAFLERSGYRFKDYFVLGERYIEDGKSYCEVFNHETFSGRLLYILKALSSQLGEVKQLLQNGQRVKQRGSPSSFKEKFVFSFQ